MHRLNLKLGMFKSLLTASTVLYVNACNPYTNTDYTKSMQQLKQVQSSCTWIRGGQGNEEATVSLKIDSSSVQGAIKSCQMIVPLVHPHEAASETITFPVGKNSRILIYRCGLDIVSGNGIELYSPYRLVSVDRETKSCIVRPLREE